MIKQLIILLTVLLLISCISPTEYHQESSSRHLGFEVTKIKDNKYRVLFRGNEDTSKERAEDFAFLKAAQEAKLKGFHYLSVVRSKSSNISKRYNHTYDKKTVTPIQYTKKDGSVVHTRNYSTDFGTGSNRYSITRPHVTYVVEFLEDNYDQDLEVFEASEIIKTISEKYDIKIETN